MTTPTNIKRFKVKDTWKDFEVVLEVDLNRLTAERAQQINSFWTSAEDRLDEENGDVVLTVIRLAGLEVMCEILEDRGADFGDSDRWNCQQTTKKLHESEGWGGEGDGDGFGWCGIRVVGAEVDIPCFEDVAVSEVTP
ncbi:MAG: DUF2528 family protein [Pseudomonas sp.]|uniref:DUF2528 family protein n=1 Tax=Pseudomonas TaxID=286 RepID=UPI0003C07DD5|nr:DUF2528 family protein [Pseudomonas sp. VLB120]AGZ37602.1 single-stranded DNA binding protein [Pseudomonas sp. VLB120]